MKFNKLVRDKISEIIELKGEKAITSILSEKEYLQQLDIKLNEEVKEYQESKELEELADILEVIFAISSARGYNKKELMNIYQQKHNERGGFSKRIFLFEKL